MTVRDTRLIARALNQRWPITPETRRVIVGRLLRVMADPSASPREVTSAAKALMSAEAQNQADEHKAVDVSLRTEHDRLDAIARDLGLDVGLIANAEGQSGGSDSGVETTADATDLR
jgi:hypothetical protein